MPCRRRRRRANRQDNAGYPVLELLGALASALVSALVALVLEPIVTPVLLFLQCVSVISALLPGGDIDLVDIGLIKCWTGGLITQSVLDHHLACWYDIARLCAGMGLTKLKVETDNPQAAHLPQQLAARKDAVAAEREAQFEEVDLMSDAGEIPASTVDQEPEGWVLVTDASEGSVDAVTDQLEGWVRAADTTEWWWADPGPESGGGVAPHGPRP